MGFFKDIKRATDQAKEIQKNHDVGAQLADAQASMQGAQELMAAQTAAANAAVDGIDATATVTAIDNGGGMVNFQPLVVLELTVMVPGRPPYPATVKQAIAAPLLAQVQPGQTVAVKVDRADPAIVHVAVG
jgi:hypothetical protein